LRAEETMEAQTHCVYNQTRECFLGLQVKTADLSATHMAELIAERPLKSGEGVWMKPFRGIPAAAVPAPLDLICLDEECRVIDMVESFPSFQVSSSSPKPESVLALPAHSIYSSQTQPGDQLVLCVAEEMQQRLAWLNNGHGAGETPSQIAGAVLLREKPLWSGGPGVLELNRKQDNGEEKHAAMPAQKAQTHEMELTRPGAKADRPRSWLERWWSPDPRKAPRIEVPGLAAYYWDGAAPAAHGIRDISSSGLYVVTEERWYPGTLVLMTLQRSDGGEEAEERSIAVQSRAVRWGADGVGLQFILPDEKDLRSGKNQYMDAASRKEFSRFLEQLQKVK